jgi:osmotically-inducible protein OsmY
MLFVLFSASIALSACSTNATTRVASNLTSPFLTDQDNQRSDDTALEGRLKDDLDRQLPGNKIKVVVTNGDVLLVGQVATAAAKTKATSICESSPSAEEIFNYLTVNAKPSLNTNSSITSDAVNRLDKQNDLNSDLIKVVTVDDVVYIMGTNVGNLNSLRKAINGIYSIDNVQKVVNLEQVGPRDYAADTYGQ